ncbi:MAG TPA: hypothetical protein VMQ73_12925 [Methylomirabilota bacterium]|nr:hypothetical protein [Methylomirabilota bacterium]
MKTLVIGVVVVACTLITSPASAYVTDKPHFQCYSVTSDKPTTGQTHSLRDQFDTYKATVIMRPVLLCTPTDKDAGDSKLDLKGSHLVCYTMETAGNKGKGRKVSVENQFGSTTMVIGPARLLCVPSSKYLPN